MAQYASFDQAWTVQICAINVPDDCSICYRPFSETQQPVASFGPRSCSHTFGAECLRSWLESINKRMINCPACRQHWFLLTCNNNEHIYLEDNEEKADNDEEEEGFGEAEEEEGFDGEKEEQNEDGSAYNDLEVEEDTLGGMTGAVEHLRDRETAAVLVSTLYHELRDTAGNASDLEVKTMLDQALLYADLHASVPFPDTLWTQMRGMVKRMPRDSKHADWDDKVEHDWIQRLKRALKLTLDR
jgi:hypothetical protein